MKNTSTLFRALWIVSLILIAGTVQTGSVQSYTLVLPEESAPFETISLPPEALTWKASATVKAQTDKNPKLDASMLALVTTAQVSNQAASEFARTNGLKLSENRVHVQIVTRVSGMQEVIGVVNAAGGEVTRVSNDSSLIQGWLPIGSLETVAANKNVVRIRRPAEAILFEDIKAGNATTEGLNVINGSAWHSAGITGTGVKVGIIDGGFLGYTSLLGTDLPASVTVKNFVDGEDDSQVDGTYKHGTACAEIIYDIAPGASLSLAKISTNLDLQNAVSWLIDTQHVDIISTSMGWYNVTPGDGTGEFADLVQTARAAGILWVTAAGNDRDAHWGGQYKDLNGDGVHEFNTDQEINFFGPGGGSAYLVPSGYLFTVALRWDDWTDVNQDFNLYLWRYDVDTSQWSIIVSSENPQNGTAGQMPTEFANVYTSGSSAVYGFTIECYSCSRIVNFEVFAPKLAELDEFLYARSLANLADSPGAMTVAALDVTSPYPQENYSSEGPTNGPGGSELGGFNKPDISGFANVSTVSYGSVDKFNGTSSATPHVVGAAALVLSAYPSFSPDQLQAFLEGRAIDMGVVGVDSVFGSGRLYLGDTPSVPIINTIRPNLALNIGSTAVTITGSGFLDGAAISLTQSGQTDINATNIVVSGASTITCDFDLTGATTGNWNVVINNPDFKTAQLSNGFFVTDTIYYVYLPLILKNFTVIP